MQGHQVLMVQQVQMVLRAQELLLAALVVQLHHRGQDKAEHLATPVPHPRR